MFLLFTFALCLPFLWFCYDKWTHQNYPPGPQRFPFFGNMFQVVQLSPFPSVAFQRLSEKYGDVIYLKLGQSETVVLNSLDVIRQIKSHDLCVDKCPQSIPSICQRMSCKNLGIIWSNGTEWQTLRKFTLQTLREYGFGKESSFDSVINEEVGKVINSIETLMDSESDEIPETNHLFNQSTISIAWRLVSGENCDLNNPTLTELLELAEEAMKTTKFSAGLTNAFPFLYHFLPNKMGKTEQVKVFRKLKDYLMGIILARKLNADYRTNATCYIDVFLGRIEQNRVETREIFDDEQLVMCLLDLFQAGTDSTSTSLKFCVLQMIMNPEIQKKIRQEINENLGANKMVSTDSKHGLPFTFATLMECMPFSTVVPISTPTVPSQDFYFQGHLIKKGVSLVANLQAAHMDARVWGDPQHFRPERFLTNEGKLDMGVKRQIMSFGYGHRQCLGNNIAENVLFIYFTSLLRKFEIVSDSTMSLNAEPLSYGILNGPKPFTAKDVSIK